MTTKAVPNTKNMREFVRLLDGLLEEKAFSNLEGMTDNWEESVATNELLVFEVPNGIERVYKALRVQGQAESAAAVLRNISRVEKCRQPLAQNAGLLKEVIATIKYQTVLNSPVKEKCFGFLQNVATEPANQVPFFMNDALLDVTCHAIKEEKFGSCKTMALRLLSRMATHTSCKMPLFKNQMVMDAIDKVFNENKRTDAEALKGKEEALNFLWLIAMEKANRQPLFGTPFVKYAIQILGNDPARSRTKEKSLGFLTLLSSHVNLKTFNHLAALKADLEKLLVEEEDKGKTQTMAKSLLQKFPQVQPPSLSLKSSDSNNNNATQQQGKTEVATVTPAAVLQ